MIQSVTPKNVFTYQFEAEVWIYPSMTASWHFVSLPQDIAKKISHQHASKKKAWGSIPVQAAIKNTTWQTSIFPDSRHGTYILPIKAQVRKQEHVQSRDILNMKIQITVAPTIPMINNDIASSTQ